MYTIKITNPGNHMFNHLLALRGQEYATRAEACEAIYAALYNIIDGDNGCEMIERKSGGTLYTCDRQGINAEPLNPNDDPYPREDVETIDFGDPSLTLRAVTVDDDCSPSVDYVAVNSDGEIVGYFQWVDGYASIAQGRYVERCHQYILKHGFATEDGVTATVEEVA